MLVLLLCLARANLGLGLTVTRVLTLPFANAGSIPTRQVPSQYMTHSVPEIDERKMTRGPFLYEDPRLVPVRGG